MAGIFAHVEDDISKLRQLKAEIEEVKKALKGINVKVDIDIKEGLEAQLKGLMTQYDSLAQKVAETEGKIAKSMQSMSKTTESIKQIQGQAITQAVSGNTGNAETINIEAQARAYKELESQINAIIGTKEANLARLRDEDQAITRIKGIIAQLNKAYEQNGSLTKGQSAYLEKLNGDLIAHKQARADLLMTIKQQTKLEQQAEGSMKQLSIQLGLMRTAYRELTETEKASPFGRELHESIQEADQAIKQMDASIGNYQRNVGNYASGWNGLNMSIQQLAREMPALAYGPQVFFSAISNNLPILADEIKRAKNEYNELIASGQKATPVWKQLVSSLVSWQTALTVGITLLTVYGKDIVEWVKNLFTANSELKKMQEELNKISASMSSTIQAEMSELNKLFDAIKRAEQGTNDYNTAKQAILDNYGKYIQDLVNEKNELINLEGAYLRVADAIKKVAKERALDKAMGEAQDKYIKAYDEQSQNLLNSLKSAFDKRGEGKNKEIIDNYYAMIMRDLEDVGGITKKTENLLIQSLGGVNKGTSWMTGARIIDNAEGKEFNRSAYNDIMKAERALKDANLQYNEEVETALTRLSTQENEYINLTKEELQIRKESIKQAIKDTESGEILVIANGKIIQSFKDRVEAELALQKVEQALSESGKRVEAPDEEADKEDKKNQEKAIEQAKKEAEAKAKALAKANTILTKLNADNAEQEVDLIEDTEAQKLAKIEHGYKKRKKEIAKQIEELARLNEEAGVTYVNELGLTHFQQSAIDKASRQNKANRRNQTQDFLKEHKAELDAMLADVQTYQQRRLQIEKEFAEKRKALYVDGDSSKGLREGVTQGNVTNLDAQEQKAYEALDVEIASRTEQFQAWAQMIAGYGLAELERLLQEAKDKLDQMQGQEGTEAYAQQSAKVSALKQRVSQTSAEVQADPKKFKQKDWEMLKGVLADTTSEITELGGAFKEMGTDWAETTGEILETAGEVGTSALSIIDGITKLSNTSAESMQATSETSANAIKGVEKASVVLGIITTAIQVAMKIAKLVSNLVGNKTEKQLEISEERVERLQASYKKLDNSVSDAFGETKANLIARQNELLRHENIALEHQIRLLEQKPNKNADKIKELNDAIDENKSKIKDNAKEAENAIFGESIQSAIERFADAYTDAITSGNSAWTSAKDFAKETVKKMMQETIKEVLQGNKKIEKFRDMVKELMKDGLTVAEENKIYEDAERIFKDIEREVGVYDRILKEGEEANATKGTISTMSQEQGEKLDGRFLAFQITGEMIQDDVAKQTQELSLLSLKADEINALQAKTFNALDGVATQLAQSYIELQEINTNTLASANSLKVIAEDIKEVKHNTSKL